MRLNTQSDYALRLMMELAVNKDRRVTIADVATRYGISRNHLMKVAHLLGQGGFIDTIRGRAGGLVLARPAAEISLGAVVRHMESDFALVECFESGNETCLITRGCRLKGVLHEAMSAFLAVLDDTSLEDLVARNTKLTSLLRVEAA